MSPLAQVPTPGAQPAPLPELPDGPTLESLRGPVELPEPFPWLQTSLIATGVLLLLLITVLIWKYLQRRRAKHSTPPPHTQAEAKLQTAQQLVDSADYAQHLSQVIRVYLSQTTGTDYTSRTVAECLQQLPSDFPTPQIILQQWFASIENATFAGEHLSEQQRSELLDTARRILREHQTQLEVSHSQ